jgi:hypothetical protein
MRQNSPAWNDLHAYSAYGSVGMLLPVYRRLGFGANLIDSYLNDPPPGFKKNSVQFAIGISYTLPQRDRLEGVAPIG